MTRTPPSGTGAASTTVAYLFEVVFYDSAADAEEIVRVTNFNHPIDVDADGDGTVETYEAAGDLLRWGGESETSDERGQGTALEFSGVDRAILDKLMTRDFRGRRVRVWRAEGDRSTGAWSTWLVHRGLQLDDYKIRERVPEEDQGEVTAKISTRSTSRMFALQATNAVRANVRSHHAMLVRAGVSSPSDTGQQYVKQLPGRHFWGSEEPDRAADGSGDGATAGTGGDTPGGRPGGGDDPGAGPSRPFI